MKRDSFDGVVVVIELVLGLEHDAESALAQTRQLLEVRLVPDTRQKMTAGVFQAVHCI